MAAERPKPQKHPKGHLLFLFVRRHSQPVRKSSSSHSQRHPTQRNSRLVLNRHMLEICILCTLGIAALYAMIEAMTNSLLVCMVRFMILVEPTSSSLLCSISHQQHVALRS